MNRSIKRLHLLVGAGAAAAVLAPAAMAASPVSLPDGFVSATPVLSEHSAPFNKTNGIARATPLLSENSSPLNAIAADGRTAGQIADGLRYQALADAYQRVASTPTAQGQKADALRYQALANVYASTPAGSSAGDGFDWGSAGIGAGFVAFLAAMSALGVTLRTNRRRVLHA
jgi:hypothetical protein